jgi:endo-1,4-beta-xylanase
MRQASLTSHFGSIAFVATFCFSGCSASSDGNSSDTLENPSGGSGASAGASGATSTGGLAGTGSNQGGASGRGGTGNGGSAGSGGKGGASGSAGKSGAGASAGTGGSAVLGLEFVGNITTHDAVDTDGKTFSRHWNQITPENAGKWGSVQTSAGAGFNWSTLDAIYDYAQRNNIIFKQHAFVWGRQQPTGTINETAVRNWMREFCQRYPNTRLIDVVNEPPPHTTPSYVNAIGGGTDGTWQWVTNSFVWAREACPNAILMINDYSIIEYGSEANRMIEIVNTIKAAGAPIDAVGAQAHSLDGGEVTVDTVRTELGRLVAGTGLPIYITEMDISTTNDQEQLELYQRYFPLFRDSGHVKGITIWGWIYGKTWSDAPNSGLVRNGTARPAMTWLMQQLDRPVP